MLEQNLPSHKESSYYYTIGDWGVSKSYFERNIDEEQSNNRINRLCDICNDYVENISHKCDECLESFCCRYHKRAHRRLYHNDFRTLQGMNSKGISIYKNLNTYSFDLTTTYQKIIEGVISANHALYTVIELCKVCQSISGSKAVLFFDTIIEYMLWILKKSSSDDPRQRILYRGIKHVKKITKSMLNLFDEIQYGL
jgi:hypothetical protein